MSIAEKAPHTVSELLKTTFKTFLIVVVFGIAFGYIEAAVVVYLRQIFYPDGFTFPITIFDDIELNCLVGWAYLLPLVRSAPC